jgi:hypothetical protein
LRRDGTDGSAGSSLPESAFHNLTFRLADYPLANRDIPAKVRELRGST